MVPAIVGQGAAQAVAVDVVVHAGFPLRGTLFIGDGDGFNLQGPLARRRASFRPGAHSRFWV